MFKLKETAHPFAANRLVCVCVSHLVVGVAVPGWELLPWCVCVCLTWWGSGCAGLAAVALVCVCLCVCVSHLVGEWLYQAGSCCPGVCLCVCVCLTWWGSGCTRLGAVALVCVCLCVCVCLTWWGSGCAGLRAVALMCVCVCVCVAQYLERRCACFSVSLPSQSTVYILSVQSLAGRKISTFPSWRRVGCFRVWLSVEYRSAVVGPCEVRFCGSRDA